MEEDDKELLRFYRLSLDDLANEELVEIDRERDSQANMRRAENEVADLYDSPEWPSGLDVIKRESLSILSDLTRLAENARLAQLAQEADEPAAQ